jgi:CheY-like chemotaxis protein
VDRSATSSASIVVASDSRADAELVQSLLDDDFRKVTLSIDPDTAVEDFRRARPQILLLAFKGLEKAEAYYLGLFRLGKESLPPQHRAITLCSRESVQQAYQLCRRGLFDDYVLFWPGTDDVTRILMSIYGALHELRAAPAGEALAASYAAEAARLRELDSQLAEQQVRGDQCLASTTAAIAGAEHDIGQALGELQMDQRSSETVLSRLKQVSDTLRPLNEWAGKVQGAAASYRESVRNLGALAARDRPLVMVVDDDAFQRRLIDRIMESERCELRFAESAPQALSLLSRCSPALIITDYVMPEMSGIDLVKRLKSDPRLAAIPVIMLTGTSQRDVVLNSIEAGVVDFILKPFDRATLQQKVARVLGAEHSADHPESGPEHQTLKSA